MITDMRLRPEEGEIDVATVRRHLDGLPNTALDPVQGVQYMLASERGTLQRALRDRRADPTRFPMSVILVGVVPHQVSISYRTQEVEPARGLVEWLSERYTLRILDETSCDLTEQAQDPDFLFGPRERPAAG